jgi:hypothetical protein
MCSRPRAKWIAFFLFPEFIFLICISLASAGQGASIYHDGWIDFNKNGSKDIF